MAIWRHDAPFRRYARVWLIARRLRIVSEAPQPPSLAQWELGLDIFAESPSAQDAAFIARELVLASLPHSNPGDRPVWMRRNGYLSGGTVKPACNTGIKVA